MQTQNQYQNASMVLKRVREVIDKNKAADLFHKAFLRPLEIALKTWRTQNDITKPHDALPYGLKQVIKENISLNQYVLKDFQSFDALNPDQRNIQYISNNNYDNLISLIKPKSEQQKIQLCICICMYSQDKTMLRKTLAGVSNNIATFVANGISSDDIVVAVVMDGIQKVDPSVVDFFGQMEKQSNIYLDDDVLPLEAKQVGRDSFNEVDEQEVINLNNFIFSDQELKDRKNRTFAERKRQYETIKRMGKVIEELELNKKITVEDLEDFLLKFFIEKAKKERKAQYEKENFAFQENQQKQAKQILQYYSNNPTKARPLIYQTLSEAKFYSQKYMQTRENLALMNAYRVEVTYGSFDKKKKKTDQSYQELNEDQQNFPRVKMNLLFITKYKNSGKLSSHNWFFNGLCREIKCQFSILLDVGLCPEKTALFRMYSHMKNDPKCGGVCGYMNLRIQRLQDEDQKHYKQIDCLSKLFLHVADIQRAQQVEYHFAHLIDKPFEALFKFIHVLPGAFSAYRTKALQPSEKEDSKLMREYFKSLEESTSRQLQKVEYSTGKAMLKVILPDFLYNCFYPLPKQLNQEQLLYDSNVYLAEDRTLCMGIHQNGYELEYLPDAHAWVDPIKHLHGLLGQRKRWINGSFFAFQAVKRGLKSQSRGDFCLKLQIFYLTLMNMLAFVAPAMFLFTIHIAMFAFRDWFFGYILDKVASGSFQTTQFYNAFVYTIDFIYIMFMLALVFKSMHFTHRTERFIPFVYIMSTIMGMFSLAVFLVLIIDMAQGIADSFKCLGETSCSVTFLAENPILRAKFFDALPGGLMTYMIYKWVVVGVIALYVLPILIYAFFYCRCQFLIDVIFGTFAFIFYTPTYLNILNTFALCRIDDISWGTKGLDSEDNRNRELKESWKSIKILHVAKFVFWNIVVAAAMLIVSTPININGHITAQQYNQLLVGSYIRKFFMTFFLMAIIGFALFLKIIVGAMYSIGYRCTHNVTDKSITKGKGVVKTDSKVERYFQSVKPSLYQFLRSTIHTMVNDVKQGQKFIKGGGQPIKDIASLIIAKKKYADDISRKRGEEKWKENVHNRSKVVKKNEDKKQKPLKGSSPHGYNGQSRSGTPPKNQPSNASPITQNKVLAPTTKGNLQIPASSSRNPNSPSSSPANTSKLSTAPLNAYSKEISQNEIKKTSEENMNSQTEIKKSSDDLEKEPISIQKQPKKSKKIFGIF